MEVIKRITLYHGRGWITSDEQEILTELVQRNKEIVGLILNKIQMDQFWRNNAIENLFMIGFALITMLICIGSICYHGYQGLVSTVSTEWILFVSSGWLLSICKPIIID